MHEHDPASGGPGILVLTPRDGTCLPEIESFITLLPFGSKLRFDAPDAMKAVGIFGTTVQRGTLAIAPAGIEVGAGARETLALPGSQLSRDGVQEDVCVKFEHSSARRRWANMNITCREFTFASPEGLALFCREFAPAAPLGTVLCLPGLTDNSRAFAPLARRLADRYRVLTPDFRGRGRSQWDESPDGYRAGVYYQDMLQLIGEHASGRVALIGTSLGGMVSILLASQVPECIAGVVLNDVGPEVAPAGLRRIAGYVGLEPAVASWSEAAAHRQALHAAAFPDFTDADWLASAHSACREDASGSIVADYDPRIGAAFRARLNEPIDLWPFWAMMEGVPVLLLQAGLSDILIAATVERMLAVKPDLERVLVPNRGHAPTLEEPPVTAALDSFLARHLA